MDKAITYTYPIITQDLQTLLLDTPNAAHLSLRLLNVMYGDDFIELEYPEIPDGGSGQGGVPAPPSTPNDKETAGLPGFVNGNKLKIYPNSTTSLVTISVVKFEKSESFQMFVYDKQGRRVEEKSINKRNGEFQLDCSEFSHGIYFIHVIANNGNTYLGKLVKQ